jgi:hypothetical protein
MNMNMDKETKEKIHIVNMAAYNGNFETIKQYLSYCNETTCAFASCKGNLHMLTYLHEHGIKWDNETIEFASQNGHLDCLKYAHVNGCPFKVCIEVYKNTIHCNHHHCLEYLNANGIQYSCQTNKSNANLVLI